MTDDAYVPGANYALPRNESEFDRLNVQHNYLTKAVCDGRLVYDKAIKLDRSSCVLDSGTGTGIWAIDLANEVSASVEIHASDVSGANFWPNHPPNVRFSVASATSMPAGWSGKFDLVNQRFLLGALLAREWPEALSEIYRVLTPGGAVQLIEMDPRFPVPETPMTIQIRDAFWKACDALGLHFGVASHLPDLLRTAGFVDVIAETRRLPLGKTWGEIGSQGTSAFALGYRNLFEIMEKTGVLTSKEEYVALVDRMAEEWDEYGNNFPCKVVCARKPV